METLAVSLQYVVLYYYSLSLLLSGCELSGSRRRRRMTRALYCTSTVRPYCYVQVLVVLGLLYSVLMVRYYAAIETRCCIPTYVPVPWDTGGRTLYILSGAVPQGDAFQKGY